MEGEATHRHRNLLLEVRLAQTSLKEEGEEKGERRRVRRESFWWPGVLYSPETVGRGLKLLTRLLISVQYAMWIPS